MNETKLRLFEIADRLDAISKEMKSSFPSLVAALIFNVYADEIKDLSNEMNKLLS